MVLFLGAPVVTIINDSNKELKAIVLTGNGFSNSIAFLAANESIQVVVHPRGDSGLGIQFLSNDSTYSKNDLAYIQDSGGYCVKIRVDEDLNISSDIRPLPIFCPKLTRLIF